MNFQNSIFICRKVNEVLQAINSTTWVRKTWNLLSQIIEQLQHQINLKIIRITVWINCDWLISLSMFELSITFLCYYFSFIFVICQFICTRDLLGILEMHSVNLNDIKDCVFLFRSFQKLFDKPINSTTNVPTLFVDFHLLFIFFYLK